MVIGDRVVGGKRVVRVAKKYSDGHHFLVALIAATVLSALAVKIALGLAMVV
jgi:hypothetical protein